MSQMCVSDNNSDELLLDFGNVCLGTGCKSLLLDTPYNPTKLEFMPCFPRYQQVRSLKYFLFSKNLQLSGHTQWPLRKCFILFFLCCIVGKNTDVWRGVLGEKNNEHVIWKSDLCGKSKCSKVEKDVGRIPCTLFSKPGHLWQWNEMPLLFLLR